jgi:hypothetical protein
MKMSGQVQAQALCPSTSGSQSLSELVPMRQTPPHTRNVIPKKVTVLTQLPWLALLIVRIPNWGWWRRTEDEMRMGEIINAHKTLRLKYSGILRRCRTWNLWNKSHIELGFAKSRSVVKKILRSLWNRMVNWRVHKSPPPDNILTPAKFIPHPQIQTLQDPIDAYV